MQAFWCHSVYNWTGTITRKLKHFGHASRRSSRAKKV